MKILMIGPFPPPIDGCSNSNEVLQGSIRSKDIIVDSINTNTPVIDKEQGTRFSVKKAIYFFQNYSGIYKIFAHSVVYITPGQAFYGVIKYAPFILLCILIKKPYTIHLHGNYLGTQYQLLSGFKKWFFRLLISNASAAIVITKLLSKNFQSLLPESRIHTVVNFVESNLYSKTFVKKTDKLRIVYLSNLMTEKGIFEFLDALVELDKMNIIYQATIAGAIEKGIENKIRDRLDTFGSNVSYVGVAKGELKFNVLKDANVFVLPTYYKMEGLPVSILEAMATGNIIITTAHAGIPDIVNGTNGFLIEPRSTKAIVDSLVDIDRDLVGSVSSFSDYNKEFARDNFTEIRYTNEILAILYGTSKSRKVQAS